MPTTIAEALRRGVSIFVNCAHPLCFHSARLDLELLAARLGPGHGAMHADLVGCFACSRCAAAGRPPRGVFFTWVPDYDGEARRRAASWRLAGWRSLPPAVD